MFPAHLRFCSGIYQIMWEYGWEQQLTFSPKDRVPVITHRSCWHLHMEREPSSTDWLSQDSFRPAELQLLQGLQRRLAPAAPGAQADPAHSGRRLADLVTAAPGAWAPGRAGAVLMNSVPQLLCTQPIQLALGSDSDSAGRENLPYKAHFWPRPLFQHNRATILLSIQPRAPLMWRELLRWGFLWQSGMQWCKLDSMWSLHAAHVKARCLLKHLYGKPCLEV